MTAVNLGRQIGIGAIVGAGCGILGWAFMGLLEAAEATRALHPQLLLALPGAGLLLGALYAQVGRPVARGNDLIIDALCDGGPQLPQRMLPLSLFGTVAVHLFGGSVGQEGTAMQLGAAWADAAYHRAGTKFGPRTAFLSAGVAGGLAAVFGTPVAGALFALEFCLPGQLLLKLLPCALAAGLMGDGVARALGTAHPSWPLLAPPAMGGRIALAWAVFAATMAAATVLFVALTHGIRQAAARALPHLPWRMALGGAGVVAITSVLATPIYLGGGMSFVLALLHGGASPPGAFLAKGLLTALCLGTGFVGGEVTPLFFMGATLGHTLGPYLGLPSPMATAVGMGAMLSGATKTPLAWAVLVAELMGGDLLPHTLWVFALTAVCTGPWRIYGAQRRVQRP